MTPSEMRYVPNAVFISKYVDYRFKPINIMFSSDRRSNTQYEIKLNHHISDVLFMKMWFLQVQTKYPTSAPLCAIKHKSKI